jgi:hypothetical protein
MGSDRSHRGSVRLRHALGVAGLLAGCTGGEPPLAFAAPREVTAATSVGIAPMVTFSPSGRRAAAWVSAPEGGTDGRLYIGLDDDAPIELRDTLGPIEGRSEAPPKLAFGPDGALHAIYVVVMEVPEAKEPLEAIRYIRSRDGGSTWSAPVTVSHDGVFGAHSFHALHVMSSGSLVLSWLGGAAGEAGVWVTHSTDDGATWANETLVDNGTTCECCRTALASGSDGTLYLAWRHVFPGNLRDVVVARSEDLGATWTVPQRVHADGWSFDGCPRAGPAIQVDATGRVHVAWWTGKEGAAGVWYASSTDRGASFGAPFALGVAEHSRPAHVQLGMAPDGGLLAVWDDGTGPGSRILLRRAAAGDTTFGAAQPLSAEGQSVANPVIAIHDGRVAVAWTEPPTAAPAKAEAAPAAAGAATPAAGHMAHRGIRAIGKGRVVLREARLP